MKFEKGWKVLAGFIILLVSIPLMLILIGILTGMVGLVLIIEGLKEAFPSIALKQNKN